MKLREWNYCPHYWCDEVMGGKCSGYWRAHKPTDCKGIPVQKQKKSEKGEKDKAGKEGS
jgi:hypothetical protein